MRGSEAWQPVKIAELGRKKRQREKKNEGND